MVEDNYLSAGLASQRHPQKYLGFSKKGSKSAGLGAKLDARNRHQKRGSRSRVACNRCRGRKIKCTGEDPDGEPCSNCRISGHTPCTFTPRHSTLHSKVTKTRPPNLRLPAHLQTSPYDLAAVGLPAGVRQGLAPYEQDPSTMYMHSPIYMVSGASPSAAQFDHFVPVWGQTSTPLDLSVLSPFKTSHDVAIFGTTNPEHSLAGMAFVNPAIKTEDEWLANSPFSPTTSITSHGSTTSAETYPCPPTPFSITSTTTSTTSGGNHKPSQTGSLTTMSEMMFGYLPTTTMTSSICSPVSTAFCSFHGVFGLHSANELQTASSSD